MKPNRLLRPCLAVVAVASLAGCGGGGSSSDDSPAPTPSVKAIRVACVGDSITAGAGTSNTAISSYPAVLFRRLGNKYFVRNFGVSGSTAMSGTGLPYRSHPFFQAALDFKPDIVVIGLGTNDAGVSASFIQSRFQSDYTALVNDFKAASPGAKIFICRPPAFNPTSSGVRLQNEVLPLIPKIAAATGATVIDLYTPTRDKPNLFTDQLHPNNEGAALIASVVYRAITK